MPPERPASGDDLNLYRVYKPDHCERLEGPDGLISQIFHDPFIAGAAANGEICLADVAPNTSLGLMISRQVASTVLHIFREQGISIENKGQPDFPQ